MHAEARCLHPPSVKCRLTPSCSVLQVHLLRLCRSIRSFITLSAILPANRHTQSPRLIFYPTLPPKLNALAATTDAASEAVHVVGEPLVVALLAAPAAGRRGAVVGFMVV